MNHVTVSMEQNVFSVMNVQKNVQLKHSINAAHISPQYIDIYYRFIFYTSY